MTANQLEELFNKLKEKEISFDLVNEVLEFYENAKNSNNALYQIKAIDFIVSIIIDTKVEAYDDALRIALDNYELAESYSDVYPEEFKTLLDKIIYIYITKQNYQKGLEFANREKDFIDANNKDEVNRWLLNYAYIYHGIDDRINALNKLQAIIANNPTDDIKSIVLNDMVNLYIDDGAYEEAKKTLNDCYELALRINDEQGIRYSEYLKGRLYHLQNDYKNSYKTIFAMLKNNNTFDEEYFIYINEFISLLIDMQEYNHGFEFVEKYFEEVVKSDYLENKLIFFKNALRIQIALNFKKRRGVCYDSETLLNEIEKLQKQIDKNKEVNLNNMLESELLLENRNRERELTKKIKENLLSIDYNNFTSLRDFLLSYSNSLSNVLPMDEILFVLFDKKVNTVLPIFPKNPEEISTYQFKNGRLYERKIGYESLDKMVITKVIEDNKEVLLDFTKNNYAYINPITKDLYFNEKFKYIGAYPLRDEEDIFGEVIYLSKSNNIIDQYNNSILEIATSIFKANLNNIFYISSNSIENELFKSITKELNYGIFYYSDNNKLFILSDNLKELLSINNSELTQKKFNDLISQNDISQYSKKFAQIETKNEYTISYHITSGDDSILVREQAKPLIIDGNLYYVGTIEKVVIDEAVKNHLDMNYLQDGVSLNKALELLKGKKMSGVVVKSKNDIFNDLQKAFDSTVYFNNGLYYVLFDDVKIKDIQLKIKLYKELFNNVSYTIIESPNPLVRINDLIGVSEYVLSNAGLGYTVFSTELYASFISVNTIATNVSIGILEEKISLITQNVTSNNQFVGYYVTPNIPGVYDNKNLTVVSRQTLNLLDQYMVSLLNKEETISFYSLSLESLDAILKNNILNNESKIVFNVNSYDDVNLINDVINELALTKSRLIIDMKLFKGLSIENISKLNGIILGFNEDINEEYKNVIDMFINNYSFFDNEESLKISKIINKK